MGEYMRYILLLLVLLVSSFSYAQEDSESVDTENIEEVVTSALRKDTALQDTGLAVTVLTASDIESKNLKEFYDFQFNVPGVLFNKGSTRLSSVSSSFLLSSIRLSILKTPNLFLIFFSNWGLLAIIELS